MMRSSRAARHMLLAGCLGAAWCGAGIAGAWAQASPFQQVPFGYAGPIGIAGAPWGWWSIGQPIVATALWIEPLGVAWSSATVGGSQATRYSAPVTLLSPAPHLAGTLNWSVPASFGAAPPSPFLLNWSSPYVLNGASINAW